VTPLAGAVPAEWLGSSSILRVKALVAAGLLAVGLTRHHGQGIALIGAVLLAWAAFDALAGGAARR
jgi:hypothetical protein